MVEILLVLGIPLGGALLLAVLGELQEQSGSASHIKQSAFAGEREFVEHALVERHHLRLLRGCTVFCFCIFSSAFYLRA